MTDEKNTQAETSATPPPTITPKQPVPRPPGPAPAAESISTEHFMLPEIDLESISDLPDFADITSSSVNQAPTQGSVRHGGGRISTGDHAGDVEGEGSAADSDDEDGDDRDGQTFGTKVKGWAVSALDSVKSLGPKPKDDADDSADADADSASYAFGSNATGSAAPSAQFAKQQDEPDRVQEPKPAAEGFAPTSADAAAPDTGTPRQAPGGPRKVRLAIARLDPWSVMKLSFLMSVAIGIMLVVATWVFWYALNDLGVFTSIDELIGGIVGQESADFDFLQYLARDKVMSVATLIAVVDVVLLTALATIGAFLYNIVAALVGGIHMTMTDD